jgi:D-hexose-6-phosphate mutarotase
MAETPGMRILAPAMNLPASVRLSEIDPSYPVFEIDHPTCVARVALHGAHVMSWRPVDEEEVLYLSPDAVFKEGKAIRGGIPVCWPWFNAKISDEVVLGIFAGDAPGRPKIPQKNVGNQTAVGLL